MSRDRTPEEVVAAAYDQGAAAYEEHWAPALHRHARALVEAIPPPRSERGRTVLDVAAGAGTLTPMLRAAAGPRGLVVAFDRSHGMLSRAPRDLFRVQADASRLPVADASADMIVLAFVLFILPDALAGAREAARVLRPGGWLLAATWSAHLDTGADAIVREELDRVGAPGFPSLPRSDHLTDTAERMAALVEAAGLREPRTERRPLDATFDARSVLAMRTGCGMLGWRYSRLDSHAQESVRRRAAERLDSLAPEHFVDRSEVLLTWARRG